MAERFVRGWAVDPSALAVLEMPALSRAWATENVSFPWPVGEAPPNPMHWPIRTEWTTSQLGGIAAELDGPLDVRINELPAEELVDNPDWLDDARDELHRGLTRLRAWVGAAAEAGHSLVLVMDGDQ
jgi:hypothetical protein